MAKKSAKAAGPRVTLVKNKPKHQPGPWATPEVFRPKNAPPDINTEFALTKGKSSVKPCTRKAGGKDGKVTKELRECHVELVFQGKGAAIRLCTAGGEAGVLIPVKNHREATSVSSSFCRCLRQKGDRQICATDASKRR